MKKLTTFFLGILVILSCEERKKSSESSSILKKFEIQDTYSLKGQWLKISDSLGIPDEIYILESDKDLSTSAVISDITNVPPLHYVNLSEDKYISKIGREGKGPGEFGALTSIYSMRSDGEILVTDPNNLRLTQIDLNNTNHLKKLYDSDPDIINLEFNGLPFDVFPAGKEKYIAVGPIRTSKNKSFAILDKHGKQVQLLGKIPDFNHDLPAQVNQLAWRAYATPQRDGNLFAIAFYNLDLIYIYNSLGKLINGTRGPTSLELDYKMKQGRLSLSENTIRSYIDIAGTEDYLYALYSGLNINKLNNNYGKYVFVFDWDSNFIRSYKLDQYAFGIDVDKKSNTLYATVIESLKPGIYKYELEKQ